VDGELEQIGDKWRLRFTRRLAHPADVVWRALTEPDHLAAWFPDRIVVRGGWSVGASLRFEPSVDGVQPFDGEVLALDPPKALEFRWGTDILRFELEPTGAGCVLTLLDTIDEVGKAARDTAGWHVCIDKLELHLDGATPPWTDGDRWSQLHPGYVAAFGPEASAIGPPEGWEG
jgi:uncharacterized protein YndB with AHSA1/START domain